MGYNSEYDRSYWNLLNYIKRSASNKNISVELFIENELLKMKPLNDELVRDNIMKNAGTRD